MKINALRDLPAELQEFYNVVKTLKAKEAKKESSKVEALASLIGFLGEDKSVLIVTQKTGLAVCDVNPQAHAESTAPTPARRSKTSWKRRRQ